MVTNNRAAWLCLVAALIPVLDARAIDIDALPYPLRSKQTKPIQVDRKNRTIEDVVERYDAPYSFPQLVPLQGITISGLGPSSAQTLGATYFVVIANTKATRMTDIYRENRAAGKANYVTVDSVLHPYLAYSNRVHADLIKRYFTPLTRSLLLSMMQVCSADYKQAEDNDVRADILCNMAFLGVAIKLIDSSYQLPNIQRLEDLVQADLAAIRAEKPAKSAVFDREEDFSHYRPTGWYKSSPELDGYFRLKEWLSRLSYPVNDIDFASGGARANNFRRSVLLYRSLDLAEVDGKPAYDAWMRLVKAWFMLGSQIETWNEKNLYSHDYRTVFKTNSADLRITLNALAEPLYRTKLLLAVRRQKPVSLTATSIFDIGDAAGGKDSCASFRLMPSVGSPEEPWLRNLARKYPASMAENPLPAALMILNARGASRASNLLIDTAWALDGNTVDSIVDLKSRVLKRLPGGQLQPAEHRIWNLVTPLFRLPPDGVQTVLRCEPWAARRMETALAAWIDSLCVIAPPLVTPPPRGSGAGGGGGTGSGRSAASKPVHAHLGGTHKNDTAKSDPKGSGGKTDTATHATNGEGATTQAVNGADTKNSVEAKSVVSGAPSVETEKQNYRSATVRGAFALPATSGKLEKPHFAPEVPSPVSVDSPKKQAVDSPKKQAADPTVPHPPTNDSRRTKPSVAKRIARGHYVDPCPELYQKLVSEALFMEKEATALGFSIGPHKARLDDFVRLFQRLERIATDELTGKPLSPADLNLLSGIDTILDKIDVPLAEVLPIEGVRAEGGQAGFNLALGRPGQLYVILQNKATSEWTLARGAVYTYYELPGAPLTAEALLAKIDSAKAKLPYWSEKFDLIQTDYKRGKGTEQ